MYEFIASFFHNLKKTFWDKDPNVQAKKPTRLKLLLRKSNAKRPRMHRHPTIPKIAQKVE